MCADSNKQSKSNEEINIPDFTQLWKEMYFKNESAWADMFKELITTETFVKMLNKSLDQYLAYEKVMRQNLDKYMEMIPVPSKKDIAQLSELIVSIEDKIDNMESQFSNNITNMADSMLKMVDFQQQIMNEVTNIRNDFTKLDKKINSLTKKINTLTKEPRSKKTADSHTENEQEGENA